MISRIEGAWPLYLVWVLVLIVVVVMTLFYEMENTSFHGIAETREIVVNSESPVEIKQIHVVEGQSIKKGVLLVELNSPELTLKINQIAHQLEQLKAQKGVNRVEVQSRIDQLKAEKIAQVSNINNQIRQHENQYNINKALTSGLKSIHNTGGTDRSDANSPIKLKIDSLKQELALCVNPLNIQIDLLQKVLDTSDSPIKIQVTRLEKELALLKFENSKLNIYSQISGIIGSVNFKPGEKVAPFVPILTLHTKTPSFIKGYIYENVYTRVSVGNKVNILSMADGGSPIKGTVVGVGARIVEYPLRLRKHPDLQAWGREIVVKIPETNPFILGEKVLINAEDKKVTFFQSLQRHFSPEVIIAQDLSDNHAQAESHDGKPSEKICVQPKTKILKQQQIAL